MYPGILITHLHIYMQNSTLSSTNFYFYLLTARVPSVYHHVDNATQMVYAVENSMYEGHPISQDKYALMHIFNTMLDLAAYDSVTQACILVMSFRHGTRNIMYMLESGSYIGFLHNSGVLIFDEPHGHHLLYRIFTPSDIEKRAAAIKTRSENIRQSLSKVPTAPGILLYSQNFNVTCSILHESYHLQHYKVEITMSGIMLICSQNTLH